MFLCRLSADKSLNSVPVVMVSSDRTRDRAERLLGMGARAYVVKPFHPEALLAELERVLERRQ
jgi:DNA-binding response OmpR family regulator